MTPEKLAFYESLKDAAIEQQIKYGVPASVTLAQAWIEHGSYSKSTNNYFGIHDDDGYWRRNGGQTVVLNDHGRMAHFRVYGSMEQGIEDHSRFFFRQNSRYSAAYGISPMDEKYGEKWATVICRAGYAERPKNDPDRYARQLIGEIRDYDLKKYDQQAVALAAQRGQTVGYMRGSKFSDISSSQAVVNLNGSRYGMPLRDSDKLIMTSDFGHRNISYGSTNHTAIDLHAAKGTAVYATEGNGIVVGKGFQSSSNGKAGGGNYVYVAYPRPDNSYVVTGYLHMDKVDVNVGDRVSADTAIGKSGNTGGVAAHLDFRVCTVTGEAADRLRNQISQGQISFSPRASGTYIDPKKYLVEIAVKGGLAATLVSQKAGDGQDLLAQYKAGVQPDSDQNQRPEFQQPQVQQNDMAQNQQDQQQQVSTPGGLLSYLLGDSVKELEKFGGLGGSGDLIGDLIGLLFSGAIAVCAMRNNTTADEIQQGVDEQKESKMQGPSAVIDRTLVAQERADGVNPKNARSLAEMNAEAGLAEIDHQQQQQRTISMS